MRKTHYPRLISALWLGSLLPLPGIASERLALVIGNSHYNIANGYLPNATGDAKAIADALRAAGFDVMEIEGGEAKNKLEFEQAANDFIARLPGKEIALFFYSGHGVQMEGANYLIPTQETITDAYQIKYKALNINYVIDGMSAKKPNLSLVVLDACRDNPFPKSDKSGASKGLGRMDAPNDMLIAYATAPNQTADDGQNGHSPYAQAWLQGLTKAADTPIPKFLNDIGIQVVDATGGKQSPRVESSPMHYSYCFRHCNDVEPSQASSANSTRLTINTSPAGALVRILNLATAYQPGLTLKPGRYQLEVTHPGYARHLAWLNLAAGEQVHSVVLEEPNPASSVSTLTAPPTASTDRYGIKMLPVNGGCFQMGSPAREAERENDERQHQVCVDSFKLGETEVTQGQWRAVMGSNSPELYFKNCGDDCPVESVSWQDVQTFIAKLNSQTGQRYRLPSEAEWEYAARAGTATPFSFGGNITPEQANYDGNYPYKDSKKGLYRQTPVPVKSLPANPWGLYEMHGNVGEWTGSLYQDNYDGQHEKESINHANDNARLAVRGGSWDFYAQFVRSANRSWYTATVRHSLLGFRLAQD